MKIQVREEDVMQVTDSVCIDVHLVFECSTTERVKSNAKIRIKVIKQQLGFALNPAD